MMGLGKVFFLIHLITWASIFIGGGNNYLPLIQSPLIRHPSDLVVDQVAYPAPDISSRLWVWEQELPCAGVFWQARGHLYQICEVRCWISMDRCWISVGMLAWCWLMFYCWDVWCEFSVWNDVHMILPHENLKILCVLGDGPFRSVSERTLPKMSGFFLAKVEPACFVVFVSTCCSHQWKSVIKCIWSVEVQNWSYRWFVLRITYDIG